MRLGQPASPHLWDRLGGQLGLHLGGQLRAHFRIRLWIRLGGQLRAQLEETE